MRTSLNTLVGQRVRELRKLAGITQQDWAAKAAEVAERLGLKAVSWQQHGKMERGDQVFSVDDLEIAAALLKVAPTKLFPGDDEEVAVVAPPPQAGLSPEELTLISYYRAGGRKAAILYLASGLVDQSGR